MERQPAGVSDVMMEDQERLAGPGSKQPNLPSGQLDHAFLRRLGHHERAPLPRRGWPHVGLRLVDVGLVRRGIHLEGAGQVQFMADLP